MMNPNYNNQLTLYKTANVTWADNKTVLVSNPFTNQLKGFITNDYQYFIKSIDIAAKCLFNSGAVNYSFKKGDLWVRTLQANAPVNNPTSYILYNDKEYMFPMGIPNSSSDTIDFYINYPAVINFDSTGQDWVEMVGTTFTYYLQMTIVRLPIFDNKY